MLVLLCIIFESGLLMDPFPTLTDRIPPLSIRITNLKHLIRLWYMCTYVHMSEYVPECAMACVWRSEDNQGCRSSPTFLRTRVSDDFCGVYQAS